MSTTTKKREHDTVVDWKKIWNTLSETVTPWDEFLAAQIVCHKKGCGCGNTTQQGQPDDAHELLRRVMLANLVDVRYTGRTRLEMELLNVEELGVTLLPHYREYLDEVADDDLWQVMHRAISETEVDRFNYLYTQGECHKDNCTKCPADDAELPQAAIRLFKKHMHDVLTVLEKEARDEY